MILTKKLKFILHINYLRNRIFKFMSWFSLMNIFKYMKNKIIILKKYKWLHENILNIKIVLSKSFANLFLNDSL